MSILTGAWERGKERPPEKGPLRGFLSVLGPPPSKAKSYHPSGTSGHVTAKSSICIGGVLYQSGVYAAAVSCLTPGDLHET